MSAIRDLRRGLASLRTGLLGLSSSIDQARLAEVMKVLTITATVFIPLSFIAGVYGMNFDPRVSPLNMPGYFHRKGWIGRASRK